MSIPRAPREDGAVVAEPPLSGAARLAAENRLRLAGGPDVHGRPWRDLRDDARRAVLEAARDYLGDADESVPETTSLPLVMAGHQPELFHPGVWLKNFALNGLARAVGAAPVNLVVDNDTAKSAALRIPADVTESHPFAATVPFDHWTGEAPYEERTVRDEALFATFAERARPTWPFPPLLGPFWEEVLAHTGRTPLLGERFARARRTFERRWGCHNLEVPVSRVCRTEPFAHFAVGLLSDLPRFHAQYNATVRDYRRRHGLRSRNHPVPDLAANGDWLEAPFWAWRAGQERRGRLMARATAGGLELRAGGEVLPPLTPPTPDAWLGLERRGFKVRSRALTNTLFARAFLADLFVHGIGGGKYDELTDALIRDYYGVRPPGFLVLSGTLLLPLPAYPARAEDLRRLAREARDLHYNPQRHLGEALAAPEVRARATRRQEWVERRPADAAGRRERFLALRALGEQLRAPLAGRARSLRHELSHTERQLGANAVLRRRDYAFCLYPESALRPFFTPFLVPSRYVGAG